MDHRIHIVIALMGEDIRHERSLEELAQYVNLSPSRLRHLFKHEVGLSPMQYLKILRMRKAKELIETTFLNIKEITNRIGMKNYSHFSKDFKNTFGLTPSQYRAHHFRRDSSKATTLAHT